jgi:translation initiation factor IF-2
MPENKETIRLNKAAKEFNVGVSTLVEFLGKKGFQIDSNPNTKIDMEMYGLLEKEFQKDKVAKEESKQVVLTSKLRKEKETLSIDENRPEPGKPEKPEATEEILIKDPAGRIEAEVPEPPKAPEPVAPPVVEVQPEEPKVVKAPPVVEAKAEPQPQPEEDGVVKAKAESLTGPKVLGKVELIEEKKPGKKGGKKQKKTAKPAAKKAEKAPAKAPEAPIVEKPVTTVPEAPKEVAAETPAPETVEPPKVTKPEAPQPEEHITKYEKIGGPTILGKMELPVKEDKKKPVASSDSSFDNSRKKRKRIQKGPVKEASSNQPAADAAARDKNKPQQQQRSQNFRQDRRPQAQPKAELTQEEIDAQIKETLARLSGTGKSAASKYRRQKRDSFSERMQEELQQQEAEKSVLKVTEFISANELASLMNMPVNKVISTCMSLGMFVSINQRLSAEVISIVAEEFGFKTEFVSAEATVVAKEEEDSPEDLQPRSPIVTVMGHVDHGKTSLLDYVRKANVIAGEAGGITQHIGAYSVTLDNGKKITFLDTPGHEAFTAMRARGAQVTDIVIIVVAADDSVMPQTREAINHAQAAGVPIIIAINKIDKPGANPDKIKEELAGMNILVEEWGGKYQSQEISAKKGTNIDLLLEKVLLEAELLDLKANPNKNAVGTVIESTLDKGRGYVTTVLVQAGTMQVGDIILAGSFSGKIKAMFNERGATVKKAGPSTPVLLLGISGAAQAGDKFKIMDDEREAKEIASKRLQLLREQGYRTQKHITLDEIGRRLAIGDFKELNIIVKGDVDGSVEALTDSLLKLSSEKIQVNVIHKSVGQVTESDVLLASASDAIIIAFQVRPSTNARKLAEQEQIDIRMYSIIYDAINEVKTAMEGMLAPEFEEKIVCNLEIREVFRNSKVGSIAGCKVLDGKITRNTKVRIIRDGIVVYTGELGSLKRFKDDVREVAAGFECGLNINNFNDIKEGDIVEGYEMVEVKR